MATRIKGPFKLVKGPDGFTRVVKDRKAQLNKMDLCRRLKAEKSDQTKIRYKRGK